MNNVWSYQPKRSTRSISPTMPCSMRRHGSSRTSTRTPPPRSPPFIELALPMDGIILDLMSSWISHLPSDLMPSAVIGHGMNAQELAANPRLTQRFIQDLNRTTDLPLDTACLDAALCCVGVQYLQKPIEVFREVARALRPGAPFIVSFSNRCFPPKAVAVWRALDGNGHASLVRFYLEQAGFRDVAVYVLADGSSGNPLTAVLARRA